MKIAIGLPHINESVNAKFADSLVGLMAHSLGLGLEIVRISTYRDNITYARNKIASKALNHEADYLLFLDDDMLFDPDLLDKLLKDNLDIVGGLTFIRSEPHEPSMYTLNSDTKTYNPIYMWKAREIVECDAIGMASTLIKREVLEQMQTISQYNKGIWGFFDNYEFMGEDLRFCKKAGDLGIKIHCDTSALVGHITEKIVSYPDYKALSNDKIYNINKYQAERAYENKGNKNK